MLCLKLILETQLIKNKIFEVDTEFRFLKNNSYSRKHVN